MIPDKNGSPSRFKQGDLMRKDFKIKQLPGEILTSFMAIRDLFILSCV